MDKQEISPAGKTETSVAESDASGNKTETSVASVESDAPENKTITSVDRAESEGPDNNTETSVAGAKRDVSCKTETPFVSVESDTHGNMAETSVPNVESYALDNKTKPSVAVSESDAPGNKTDTLVAGMESDLPRNKTETPVVGAESDAPENKTQRSVVDTEGAASGAKQKALGARRKRSPSHGGEEMKPKRRMTFKNPIEDPSPIICSSLLNVGGAAGMKDTKFEKASSLQSGLKSPTKFLKVKEKSENAPKSPSIARHDNDIETSGDESDAPGNKVESSVVAEISASGAEQKALGSRPKYFLSLDKEKKKQSCKRRVTFKVPISESRLIRCFSSLNLEEATETQEVDANPLQSSLKSTSEFGKEKEKRKNYRKTRLISNFDKASNGTDESETSDVETEALSAQQKSLDSLSKDQSKQFPKHRFTVEKALESPVKESGPSNLFSALHMERTKNANSEGVSSLQSSSKSQYNPREVRKDCLNAPKQDAATVTSCIRIIDNIVYDEMSVSKKRAKAESMLKSFESRTTNGLNTKEVWARDLNWAILDIGEKNYEDKLALYNEDPYSKYYRNIHFQEINVDEEEIKAVEKHGFENPSAVQKAVMKKFFGYQKNVIAELPPSSCKTRSLIIACLRTIDLNLVHPQVIIVYFRRADSTEALNAAKEMKYFPEVTFHLAIYPCHEGTVEKHIIVGKPFHILFLKNNRCFNPKKVVILAVNDVQNANLDDFIVICEKLLTRMRKTVFAVALPNSVYTTKIQVMDIRTQILKNPAYLKVSSKKCIAHFLFYCFRESERVSFIKKAYKFFNRFSSKFVVFFNYPDSVLERTDNLRNNVCVLHEYLTREEIKQRLMNIRSKPEFVCTFATKSNLFTIVGDFIRTAVNRKSYFARTGKIEIAGVVIDLATHLDDYSINELNKWFEYRVLNI